LPDFTAERIRDPEMMRMIQKIQDSIRPGTECRVSAEMAGAGGNRHAFGTHLKGAVEYRRAIPKTP